MTFRNAALTALFLTAATLSATGCGRKGDLERPSAAARAQSNVKTPAAAPLANPAAPASTTVQAGSASQTTSVTQMNTIPDTGGKTAGDGKTTVADRPFLLDPLL